MASHLPRIKVIFYGQKKDVKIDTQFKEKKDCLDSLGQILPQFMKEEYQQYFVELYGEKI